VDRTEAEELAQETFLRCHRHWSRVAGYDKPGAWLRRVMVNLTTSRGRRLVREARALARLGSRPSSTPELGPRPSRSGPRCGRFRPARPRPSPSTTATTWRSGTVSTQRTTVDGLPAARFDRVDQTTGDKYVQWLIDLDGWAIYVSAGVNDTLPYEQSIAGLDAVVQSLRIHPID
jgi:hypothetical protein